MSRESRLYAIRAAVRDAVEDGSVSLAEVAEVVVVALGGEVKSKSDRRAYVKVGKLQGWVSFQPFPVPKVSRVRLQGPEGGTLTIVTPAGRRSRRRPRGATRRGRSE